MGCVSERDCASSVEHGLHMIAVDSMGNIYTGEVFAGERVQRFVPTIASPGPSPTSAMR